MNGRVQVKFHSKREKVIVLHCPAGVTWMDDELVHGLDGCSSAWRTCVNHAALIIDVCLLSKSNLQGHLSVADLAISVLEAGLVLV